LFTEDSLVLLQLTRFKKIFGIDINFYLGPIMKKLIIALVLSLSTSTIFAEVAVNTKTGKFYSKNAPKNINQEEYHQIWVSMIQWAKSNPYIHDFDKVLFMHLRTIGTPTAIRVIHDLQQLHKEAIKDLKKLNGPWYE